MPLSELYIQKPNIPGEKQKGRQAALDEFEKRVTESIDALIKDIVNQQALNKEKPAHIKNKVNSLYKNINSLSSSVHKKTLMQKLRFLILVINNRLDSIKLTPKEKESIIELFSKISQDIGVVPSLNETVEQPNERFLPQKYESSFEKWKITPIENPREDFSKGRLGFISYKEKGQQFSSARCQLLEENQAVGLDEKSEDRYALSYTRASFINEGDLHVDHFQPHDDILFRQLELLEAMNLDPIFCDHIIKINNKKKLGYFSVDEKGVVLGTKKLYSDYYNCMANLWTINAGDNTGKGKGKKNPLIWLQTKEIYRNNFLKSTGRIVSSFILHTTEMGVILGAAAKAWFLKTQSQRIAGARFVLQHVQLPVTQLISKPDIGERDVAKLLLMQRAAVKSPPKKRKESSTKTSAAAGAAVSAAAESQDDDESYKRPPKTRHRWTDKSLKEAGQIWEDPEIEEKADELIALIARRVRELNQEENSSFSLDCST